jgi:hypothetical protein
MTVSDIWKNKETTWCNCHPGHCENDKTGTVKLSRCVMYWIENNRDIVLERLYAPSLSEIEELRENKVLLEQLKQILKKMLEVDRS